MPAIRLGQALFGGVLLLPLGCAGTTPHPATPAAPTLAAAPTPAAATTPAAGPTPNDNLTAVVWMQRAQEHDLIFREIYAQAGEKLLAALADPQWDALPRDERDTPFAGLPPAVIMDVDETVLDNSPYEVRLIRSGEEFGEFTWSQWCREAVARPLPGAVEFGQLAAAHGIHVFYISNRAKDLDTVTLANLGQVGMPVAEGSFLGLGALLPGCEQVGSDKDCRRRLVGRSYRVLEQLGDQLDDFVEVLANDAEHRGESVAPYADWVGVRWFVFPNTVYGSWMPALFHNDWTQPPAVRRRAQIDALRDH